MMQFLRWLQRSTKQIEIFSLSWLLIYRITVSININGSLVTEGQMEGEQNQEEANEEEQGDVSSEIISQIYSLI